MIAGRSSEKTLTKKPSMIDSLSARNVHDHINNNQYISITNVPQRNSQQRITENYFDTQNGVYGV